MYYCIIMVKVLVKYLLPLCFILMGSYQFSTAYHNQTLSIESSASVSDTSVKNTLRTEEALSIPHSTPGSEKKPFFLNSEVEIEEENDERETTLKHIKNTFKFYRTLNFFAYFCKVDLQISNCYFSEIHYSTCKHLYLLLGVLRL